MELETTNESYRVIITYTICIKHGLYNKSKRCKECRKDKIIRLITK